MRNAATPEVRRDMFIIQCIVLRDKACQRSKHLYQHKFYFKTAEQAKLAVDVLLQTNVIAMNVEVRPRRCRSLSFRSPYLLGPIMREVLRHEMQPDSAMFNRQPRTWEKFPLWHRVTLWQVVLTLLVFALFCGLPLLRFPLFNDIHSDFDFWDKVTMGLLLTALVACVSNDVLGLVQCHWRKRLQRKGGRT